MKLALAFAVIALPAIAQTPACVPFQQAQDDLAGQFGEQVLFVGLDQRGGLMVVFLNAATETWTAMVVRADGMACPVASGEAGAFLPPEANGVDG
jgi:hypothetical protein